MYQSEIAKFRLLTPEEVSRNFERIEQGRAAQQRIDSSEHPSEQDVSISAAGREAEELVFVSNLRLVVSIANRYPETANISLLDHIQSGNIGLHRAIQKFDRSKGIMFSTYATWWIRRMITVNREKHNTTVKIGREDRRAINSAEMNNTLNELNGHEHFARAITNPISLNGQVGDDGAETGDFIADQSRDVEREAIMSADASKLDGLIDLLDSRYASVIRMHYGIGCEAISLRAVARKLGVSAQTTSRWIKLAESDLRRIAARNFYSESEDLISLD